MSHTAWIIAGWIVAMLGTARLYWPFLPDGDLTVRWIGACLALILGLIWPISLPSLGFAVAVTLWTSRHDAGG